MGALADWRSCLILSIWTCVEVSMMMIALPPSSWASAHEHSRNETNPGLPAPWLSATFNVTSLPSWNASPTKTRVADTDGPDSFPVSKYPYSMHPAADLHPSFSARVPPINNSTLTLGYLVEDRGKVHAASQDWKLVSGALAYAVHEINQDGIVPGYNLTFVVRNTHMQTNDSLLAMSNLWRDGVVGFIGSAASCQSEAMLAGAWNLPILAHLCSVDAVSDKQEYPTFVRTFPSADAIITPVVSLLQHFSWNKFSIIYGKSANKMDENLAETLKDAAGRYGMTVNHMRHYSDRELVTNSGEIFSKIVQETYVDTRIYVLLGALNALVDFMITLNSSGLLDGGEYEIIFVELVEGLAMEPNKYFKKTFWNVHKQNLLIEAARSLLVVKSSPHEGFEGFYDIVRHYNEQPPFSFRTPKAWTKRIPVQATCLYDAVMLYAYALRKVLEEGGSYNDGRAIVGKILGHAFRSIQGYFTKIDKNGNAEGNFTVLALQEHADNSSIVQDMFPVANFLMNDEGELPKFNLYEGVSLNWVSGKPPVAEPSCGYRGQKCVKDNSSQMEIAGGFCAGLVLVIVFICFLLYRNWRNEQEIAGLLWKIDREAIQYEEIPNIECSKNKYNNDSCATSSCEVSTASMDSRNSLTQVYTCVGKYKGQTVALKSFRLQSSDLTRRDKMEMKMLRDLRHTNVNTFIGACLQSSVLTLVSVYCFKGSLQDVLENEDIKVDNMFISSLIKDLIQGMLYIHNSEIIFHGNLKSSNCVVTSRWTLQVTDMGLLDIRNANLCKGNRYAYFRNMLWKAPEILGSNGKIRGSQAGDVYAFAIILHEIYGRAGPYGGVDLDPQEIVFMVKNYHMDTEEEPFRPPLSFLSCDGYIKDLMAACWAEDPVERPDFHAVWSRLKPMRTGINRNIMDHMLAMMEKYQEHLEELVDQRTEQLSEEKKKTEILLYRMLPKSVADQLKKGEAVVPEAFDSVTVYFSDICGFTSLSAESGPMQIVDMLNDLYTLFDSIIQNFDVYKVETIGDAYMVVSGLPIRNGNSHAAEIASMSLILLTAIKSFKIRHKPDEMLKLRTGMHSGPCVAGIVGLTMPRYTLFGDTVNTASRMETNGEALKIHCSAESKRILDMIGGFQLEERGYVAMKGKGKQLTYWLLSEDRSRQMDIQKRQQLQDMQSLKGSSKELLLAETNKPQQKNHTFSNIHKHNHMHTSNHHPCHITSSCLGQDLLKSSSVPDVISSMHQQFLTPVFKERSRRSPQGSLTDVMLAKRSREKCASYYDNGDTTATETTLLMNCLPSGTLSKAQV